MTGAGEWDVLVVGAGPAGSRAAEAAAVEGAKVLLVEKREKVGVPVQCAEFLHRNVVLSLDLPDEVLAQDIREMVTYVNGHEEARSRGPGHIIHRDLFDALLAGRAVEAGAELWTGRPVVGPLERGRGIDGALVADPSKGCGQLEVGGRTIVGADGPLSIVASWIGCENKDLLVANQVTVGLREPTDVTEVYLGADFPGGYGWLFPKGDVANIGVGVDTSLGVGPKEALRRLRDQLGDRVEGKARRVTAGLIPVNGPSRTVVDNIVLVGDAGGFTHPITGGGIYQAVETGAMAGRAAACGDLDDFVRGWEPLFGRGLWHGARRRAEMMASWKVKSGDEKDFLSLIRRCWIGFEEYNR